MAKEKEIKSKFNVGELVRCTSRLPVRLRLNNGGRTTRVSNRRKLFDDVGIILEVKHIENGRWSGHDGCWTSKTQYQIRFFQTSMTVFLNDIHVKKAK